MEQIKFQTKSEQEFWDKFVIDTMSKAMTINSGTILDPKEYVKNVFNNIPALADCAVLARRKRVNLRDVNSQGEAVINQLYIE